jgi:hypothetical protein
VNGFFNTSAFVPSPFVPDGGLMDGKYPVSGGGTIFGNLGRNILRGPEQQDFDIAVIKTTPLTDRVELIFRSEIFNLLNRPNFANPSTDVSTPSTFGVIRSLAVNPRIMQYALKLQFKGAPSGTLARGARKLSNEYPEAVQSWQRASRLSQSFPGTCWSGERLREGADFTLYRGLQRGDAVPVLVVALAEEQPSPQGPRRLEHEFSLASELDPAWASKPLAITRHEGRTILVLTDPGGEPLDLVLERGAGRPLDLTRVLRIAIGLATVLGQVHRQGLIHKDIKPANILVDDASNVWLTGFGIASQLPHERQGPGPREIIAGTLAYMAPEQTGRMNRTIDARSDLYSLGVTLYQMLTGALPFAAADPLEWVHCHIARQPTPPGDRAAVPEPVSSLTMKLLAKNAEERYQTASGLEADLRQCLAEWLSHGRIEL